MGFESNVAIDAGRLRELSEEVNRIASALARLTAQSATIGEAARTVAAEDLPPASIETVRTAIRARRLRATFFDEQLFAEPAWDMLLNLFQAELAQLRVPVSNLCAASAVPPTTALRWVKALVEKGLFVRRADAHDARRVFIELSPEASLAMRRYFAELEKPAC